MQVSSITNKTFNNVINKTAVKSANYSTNTISKSVNPQQILGATAAAITGGVVVDKAVDNFAVKNQLKKLGISEETAEIMTGLKKADNKPVFDNSQYSIRALALAGRVYPKVFKLMLQNPQLINECQYVPANKEKKINPHYSVKFDNIAIQIEVSGANIHSHKMTVKGQDGSSITRGQELIRETNCYKNTSVVKSAEGTSRTISETPIISDVLGIVHKSKTDIIRNNKKQLQTVTKTNSDGSHSVTTYKYDNQSRPIESVIRQYSREGVIDAETTTKYDYTSNEKQPLKYSMTVDYRNNSVENQTALASTRDEIQKQVLKVKNPKTGKVRTEVLEQSEVKNIFNSKVIDEFGNEKVESKAVRDKNGYVNIEKHLESVDGTKTEYFYRNSAKNDDMQLKYQVISKDGEVLTTVDRVFKRVSPNKSYSSLNGHGYTITRSSLGIEIKDLLSNETTNIDYFDLISENNKDEFMARSLISQLPADAILHMVKSGIKLNMVTSTKDCHLTAAKKEISTINDLSVFLHELGHSKDIVIENNSRVHKVAANPIFRQEYEKEKAAFLKAFSEMPKSRIDYFINELASYAGPNGAPSEAVAEINALLTGCVPLELNAVRMSVLQKYFPRTIAVASKMLNPNANIYVGK